LIAGEGKNAGRKKCFARHQYITHLHRDPDKFDISHHQTHLHVNKVFKNTDSNYFSEDKDISQLSI